MASFYVYAPQNGSGSGSTYWATGCTSGSKYCSDGSCHPTVYSANPIDIGCALGTRLDFWSSVWIGTTTYPVVSIVCSTISNVCSSSCNPGSPWTTGLVVVMKSGVNGGGSELGRIIYCHVNAPYAGIVNTVNGGVTYLGYVPSDNPPCAYCQCPGGGCVRPNCCCCFQGGHVHVESSGAGAKNTALGCGSGITGGGTWLYRYDR